MVELVDLLVLGTVEVLILVPVMVTVATVANTAAFKFGLHQIYQILQIQVFSVLRDELSAQFPVSLSVEERVDVLRELEGQQHQDKLAEDEEEEEVVVELQQAHVLTQGAHTPGKTDDEH